MMDKIIKGTPWDDGVRDPAVADLAALGPILDCELLEAMEEAKEILSRAKEEGARIRQRAKDLLATVVVEKDEEKKRGFGEGYEEGLAQVTEKIAGAEAHHARLLAEAEGEVVRMILESVEKILGRELKKGAVVDVVRQAIAKAVGEKIVVKVHPGDFLTVQEGMKGLKEGGDRLQSVVLKEDERISPGGCLVETELGQVDARLEVQMAAIRRAFGVS